MDIRTISTDLEQVITAVITALPDSNQQEHQHSAAKLYIGKVLESRGKKLVSDAKKFFTNGNEGKLLSPTDGPVLLSSPSPFAVTCKVSKPRESFDKDTFIKEVAKKYDLSAHELQQLASSCTKESAAPKAFDAQLAG